MCREREDDSPFVPFILIHHLYDLYLSSGDGGQLNVDTIVKMENGKTRRVPMGVVRVPMASAQHPSDQMSARHPPPSCSSHAPAPYDRATVLVLRRGTRASASLMAPSLAEDLSLSL